MKTPQSFILLFIFLFSIVCSFCSSFWSLSAAVDLIFHTWLDRVSHLRLFEGSISSIFGVFLSFKMQTTSSSLNESQLSPFHLFITQMTQWFLRLLASALFIYLCIIRAGNNTFLLEIAVSWCRNGKTFGLLHIFKSDVIKKREHLFLTFLSVFDSLKREEFSDAWPNLKTWTSANLAQKSKRRSSNVITSLFLLLFSLERHLKSPQQSNCRYRLFF